MAQSRFDANLTGSTPKRRVTKKDPHLMRGTKLPASGIMTSEEYRRHVRPFESELLFQRAVVNEAETQGWRVMYTADSRESPRGEPDLRMWHCGKARFLLAELKTDSGGMSPTQGLVVRELLELPGVEVYVWRYADWSDERIQAILKAPNRLHGLPVATDPRDLHCIFPERFPYVPGAIRKEKPLTVRVRSTTKRVDKRRKV